MAKGLRPLTLTQKRMLVGYTFVVPFVIGFVLFFLYPFVQSILFSLSDLEITRTGFRLHSVGLANYTKALFVHPTFNRVFVETITKTAVDVPLILVFSLFTAVLLSQNFRGRLVARLVFFLPVIVSADAVLRMAQLDYLHQMMSEPIEGVFSGPLREFFMQMRLPESLLDYVVRAVDRIEHIVNASGIQILVFLAGLRSIPSSYYEASTIEGATGWENMCKITLPLLSPLILTNIVYTIVDSFTAADNALVTLIEDTAFVGMGYGVSNAMSWLYFMCVALLLAVVGGLISRKVFYMG